MAGRRQRSPDPLPSVAASVSTMAPASTATKRLVRLLIGDRRASDWRILSGALELCAATVGPPPALSETAGKRRAQGGGAPPSWNGATGPMAPSTNPCRGLQYRRISCSPSPNLVARFGRLGATGCAEPAHHGHVLGARLHAVLALRPFRAARQAHESGRYSYSLPAAASMPKQWQTCLPLPIRGRLSAWPAS